MSYKILKQLYPISKSIQSIFTRFPYEASTINSTCILTQQNRWATKKSGGVVRNSKDSHPKYLGVKKFGGEWCMPGNIIIRQRGTKYRPGEYVALGKDYTINALVQGQVKFSDKYVITRRGRYQKKFVSIVPGIKPPKAYREFPSWFKCKVKEREREKESKRKIVEKPVKLENIVAFSDGTKELGHLMKTYIPKRLR